MTQTLFTDEFFDWDSSVVDSVYYDRPTRTLVVDYSSGSLRGYEDVPLATFLNFQAAPSRGRFLNAEVRRKFRAFDVDADSFVAREEQAAEAQEGVTFTGTIDALDESVLTRSSRADEVAWSSQIAYDADTALSVEHRNEYTVRFTTGQVEGVFNTTAPSDEHAVREFEGLVERLGLQVDTARVERELV